MATKKPPLKAMSKPMRPEVYTSKAAKAKHEKGEGSKMRSAERKMGKS
jgi:hypothetical protein